MDEQIEEKEDTISELLIKWNNVKSEKQIIEIEESKLKNKIKAFMKEKRWNKYFDKDTDMSISITEIKKESIDKFQLKLLLNKTSYESVVKISIYERMNILTKEAREKIKKIIK